MRILVDTNILVRIANGTADHLHEVAVSGLETVRTLGHTPCRVPQVVYEFWTVATRPVNVNGLGLTAAEARGELSALRAPLFKLLQDERAIYQEWEKLVMKYEVAGKVTHDARLVAAMMRHDVSRVLTFNTKHFERFTEIRGIKPDNVESQLQL